MGDGALNLALAHAALAASSGWSLIQCKDMKYSRVAFCVYLANGVMGVVEYVLPRNNAMVKRVREGLARWGRPLYTPLIAAEAILFAGFDEKYSYCHLIFPVTWLLLTELLKKNLKQEYLDISTICNSISIGFSAYTKQDVVGGLCAILNLVAFMGVNFDSMEYLLMISCCNVAAVQFFKQFFKF